MAIESGLSTLMELQSLSCSCALPFQILNIADLDTDQSWFLSTGALKKKRSLSQPFISSKISIATFCFTMYVQNTPTT